MNRKTNLKKKNMICNKIGIVSMHRVKNYGSFLQAYGLKMLVESNIQGAQCHFIDLPYVKLKQERPIKPSRIKYFYHYLCGHREYCNEKKLTQFCTNVKAIHEKNINQYFEFDDFEAHKWYSSVIIGSDEVFNCTQDDVPWGQTMILFGEGINSKNIISYAASFGYTDMERLEKYGLVEQVRENLLNLKAISVRDDNSLKIVEELTNKQVEKNLDPVLMYDFNEEMDKTNLKIEYKNYILVYQYTGRIDDKIFIKNIKEFAKKNRCKIISTGGYCEWADKNLISEPFTVLKLFKNAKYVVTDTFHGCVMSIKFNKQFIAFVRDSNVNKLYDLIKIFSLEDLIIDDEYNLEEMFKIKIDWEYVNSVIEKEKEKTVRYLKENIK